MPRQSRGRPAPRPAPAAPAQSRSAHTSAAPPRVPAQQYAQPPAVPQGQSQGPGMMAQMAATAGSVAVGSTIGHGLSSMLFGGGSREVAAPTPEPVAQQQQAYGQSCDFQAKEFTKCLESADVNSCTWYLDQLKACQSAAARY